MATQTAAELPIRNSAEGFRFAPHYPHVDEGLLKRTIEDTYKNAAFFGRPFLDLYQASLDATDAGINPFQAMNKLRRCHNLARFFVRTLDVHGDMSEAGVFRGSTARLLVELAAAGGYDMDGRELLLFDSFEGLPDMAAPDQGSIEVTQGTGPDPYYKVSPRRFSNTSVEAVRAVFEDARWVSTHKGWIPSVFEGFEDRRYSFVHIDVDLYQSTHDCLEYFAPRMVEGGVILCDDYLALRFPGARIAWDEFCARKDLKFITLDNYQAAMLF